MSSEYWAGQAWCPKCKQIVDVYSSDNKTFACGFCGRVLKSEKKGVKLKKVMK